MADEASALRRRTVEIHGYVMIAPWAALWVRGDVELEEDE